MTRTITEETCAGCGTKREIEHGYRNTYLIMEEVAPGRKVWLCVDQGRTNGGHKGSCRKRAIEKLRFCPGCGGEECMAGSLCPICRTNLARGKALGGDRELKWHALDVAHMFGEYLTSGMRQDEADTLGHKAGAMLIKALGCRTTDYVVEGEKGKAITPRESKDIDYHGVHGPKLELDDAQVEALNEFVSLVSKVGKALYARGKAHGHSLLRRLAEGETTVAQYEETRKKEGE